MILTSLLSIFTGPIVDKVLQLVGLYKDSKVSEATLRAEVEKEIAKTIASVAEQQKDVILAETKSEHWITYSWRPITALSLTFVMIFLGFIQPILVAWAGVPDIKADIMILRWLSDGWMICLGGYFVGRTLEKMVGKS